MKYSILALNSFLSMIAYRSNFIISLFSKAVQLSLSFFTWITIFNTSGSKIIGGYSLKQMLTYLLLTSFLSLIFTFEPIFRMSNLIKTGKLSTSLMRPININLESFSVYLGTKLPFIFIFLAISTILFISNIVMILLLLAYLVLALFLWHEIMFLIGLAGFWVIQMWPLKPIINGFYMFFGGLLFPLDLLPSSIFTILKYTPFSLVSSNFVEVFTKNQQISLILEYMIVICLWIIIFKMLSRFIFNKGIALFEGVGI